MKRKVLVILGALLLLSSVTACAEKFTEDDNISMINFTDTGENSSGIGGRTADIEYSSSDTDGAVTSQETSETDSSENDENSVSGNPDEGSVSGKSDSASDSSDSDSDSDSQQNSRSDSRTESVQSEINSSKPQNSETKESDSDSSREAESDTDTESVVSQPNSDEPAETGEFSKDDIAFFINGSKIQLGENLDSVLEILGEPDTIDTDEGSPVSRTYNYPGFWVKFVHDEEQDIFTVDAIQIYSENFETEKGVKVFMTLEEAKKVYGECSTVIDNEYRYYADNKYMYFYAPNGTVANIGYNIDYNVDNENV